jgi:chloride channel 7
MIAAGASAGVASAFGAPIGGALFSYEISKPNTFWTFSMLWRVFAATCISTFLLGIITSLWTGATFSLEDTGALKFGKLADEESSLLDLPAAVIIGIVCALLGSFFIFVNINLAILRKKYITQNWQKILEAVMFAFLSTSIFFGAVLLRNSDCVPN